MRNQLASKYFTEGDRRTSIADTLVDANGDPINLAGHTVAFRLVRGSDVLIDDAAATVDDEDAGQVSYSWAADEPPAVEGSLQDECHYWWILTRTADGKLEHFPGDGKLRRLYLVKAF